MSTHQDAFFNIFFLLLFLPELVHNQAHKILGRRFQCHRNLKQSG